MLKVSCLSPSLVHHLVTFSLQNIVCRVTFAIGEMTSSVMHQSIPAVPIPPPPGNRGAFARPVSPWGGASANLARPGGRAFAFPGANAGVLTHMVSDSKSKHGGFYRKGPAVRRRLD